MIKPFERQGNYTAVDNAVLDHLMCELSGNEFKILMTIVRRTVGWHDAEAGISVRDFQRISGIASFQTISKALAQLVKLGVITRKDVGQRAIYALNRDYELTVTETVTPTVTETVTPTVTETVTPTVTETVTASYIEKKEKEREGRGRTREPMPAAFGLEQVGIAEHPAMKVLLEAGFRWPGYDNAPEIVRRLGDEPDLDLLLQAKQFWLLSGYRDNNIIGVLDWYEQLLHDPNWSPGPLRSNGRAPAKPLEPAPASW